MGEIRAICISEQRGTKKYEIAQAELKEEWGIVGDAHAGNWHRQVSLLSQEKIDAFKLKGADIEYGAFGENLVVEGFDLAALPVGSRLQAGDVLLEVTQIGKECHSHCAIYKRMGECIMPREGVFAEVLQEGTIHPGDTVNIPAGVKHWHGAAADSWFSHLAVEVPGENCSNEWLEAVDDKMYSKLK